ncbi:MAG: hypothetical protein AB7T74_03080 [Clostridia bacterium]
MNLTIELSPDEVSRLQAIADREGVTLETALEAVLTAGVVATEGGSV